MNGPLVGFVQLKATVREISDITPTPCDGDVVLVTKYTETEFSQWACKAREKYDLSLNIHNGFFYNRCTMFMLSANLPD